MWKAENRPGQTLELLPGPEEWPAESNHMVLSNLTIDFNFLFSELYSPGPIVSRSQLLRFPSAFSFFYFTRNVHFRPTNWHSLNKHCSIVYYVMDMIEGLLHFFRFLSVKCFHTRDIYYYLPCLLFSPLHICFLIMYSFVRMCVHLCLCVIATRWKRFLLIISS